MDSSDEEEVILYVELNGLPSPDTIQACQGTCAILGIESEEPVLQIDNYVFKGRYADIIGTAMIFQQEKTQKGQRLKYLCKTGRKLSMQRLFLKKKEESHGFPRPPPPPSTTAAAIGGGEEASVDNTSGASVALEHGQDSTMEVDSISGIEQH